MLVERTSLDAPRVALAASVRRGYATITRRSASRRTASWRSRGVTAKVASILRAAAAKRGSCCACSRERITSPRESSQKVRSSVLCVSSARSTQSAMTLSAAQTISRAATSEAWLRVASAGARRERRAAVWRGGRKWWRWVGFSGRSERAERVRVAGSRGGCARSGLEDEDGDVVVPAVLVAADLRKDHRVHLVALDRESNRSASDRREQSLGE